jgi:hypothetical protein
VLASWLSFDKPMTCTVLQYTFAAAFGMLLMLTSYSSLTMLLRRRFFWVLIQFE